MYLELHDNEVGNTLNAKVQNLDYDYQAELWVQITYCKTEIIKWVLYDEAGIIRCVWERPDGTNNLPEITQRSERFQGEWQKGPNEVSIL